MKRRKKERMKGRKKGSLKEGRNWKAGRKDWVASHSSRSCTLRNHTFKVRLVAIFYRDKYGGGIGWLKSYFRNSKFICLGYD